MVDVNGIEFMAGVVAGQFTKGVGDVALAPLHAYAEHRKELVKERLSRVRQSADRKRGDRPIEVNDRIVFKVLQEGALVDDELTADYLGGILASSSGDDEASSVVSQIGRLSAFQLRLHYVIYRELRRLGMGREVNLYQESEAKRLGMLIPPQEAAVALGGTATLTGAIGVLHRESLISGAWKVSDEGIEVRPSALGAELFLWGSGSRPPTATRFFHQGTNVRFLSEVPPCPSARLLHPDS